MDKTISEVLSEFVVSQRFEDLPSEVVSEVKDHILDVTGAIIAAYDQESTKIVVEYVRSMGGKEQSTVIVHGDKVMAPNAALANGVMGHSLEMDDNYFHGGGHPAPFIYPPALAVGEREGVDGKTLILAMLVGYEIALRLGWVMRHGTGLRGFHSTAVCGMFGATCAAGQALGLDIAELTNALGLTGSMTAGLWNRLYDLHGTNPSLRKRFHAGWSSHGGVIAVELARRGYPGGRAIFEVANGVLKAYADLETEDEAGLRQTRDLLFTNLGATFELPRVSYKLWPRKFKSLVSVPWPLRLTSVVRLMWII